MRKNICNMSTSDKDFGDRQRLRPWLEHLLNSGTIPGLYWLNEDKTKFRIPWEHAGKHDWTPDKSQIFMEWAKHNGRFREGVDEPSYVQWKTRLRCALHKAADIIHIKSESNDSKDTVNAFRVYSIKRRNGQKTDCRADSLFSFPSSSDTLYRQSVAGPSTATREGAECLPKMIPSTVYEASCCSSDSNNCREAEKLPSDLCELSASDLLPAYANSSQGLSQIMDDANVSMKSDKAELCSYLPGNSRFHQVDYEHQPLTTNADVNQLTDNISAMSMEEIDHFGAYVRINHDEGTATDSCDVGSTADVPCPTLNSIAGLANHLTSDLQELQLAYTHHQLQNGYSLASVFNVPIQQRTLMDFLSPLENDRRLPTKQFVETEQHFDGAAVPFSVFGSYFGVKPLDISMGHVRDQTLEPNVMANEGTAYARQQFGIQTIGFQDLQLSE